MDVLEKSQTRYYPYCNSLERCLAGENKIIKEFSLQYFDGGLSYNHGSVLIKMLEKIGEDKYLEAIKDITSTEKQIIDAYLSAGYEHTIKDLDKIRGHSYQEIYPKIYLFLNSNTTHSSTNP